MKRKAKQFLLNWMAFNFSPGILVYIALEQIFPTYGLALLFLPHITELAARGRNLLKKKVEVRDLKLSCLKTSPFDREELRLEIEELAERQKRICSSYQMKPTLEMIVSPSTPEKFESLTALARDMVEDRVQRRSSYDVFSQKSILFLPISALPSNLCSTSLGAVLVGERGNLLKLPLISLAVHELGHEFAGEEVSTLLMIDSLYHAGRIFPGKKLELAGNILALRGAALAYSFLYGVDSGLEKRLRELGDLVPDRYGFDEWRLCPAYLARNRKIGSKTKKELKRFYKRIKGGLLKSSAIS
jgi:hypothetical protein